MALFVPGLTLAAAAAPGNQSADGRSVRGDLPLTTAAAFEATAADPSKIAAAPGGYDYPNTLVTGYDFVGEWEYRQPMDIVSEYIPVGAGSHSLVLSLQGEGDRVHAIDPGGQVYVILNSVTVNATHRDELKPFVASPRAADWASCVYYPPGSTMDRSGSCWRIIGVDPVTGCRSANCTAAAGDGCGLTVSSGGGSDDYGSESGCVESGYLEPLTTFCPDGSATVCM